MGNWDETLLPAEKTDSTIADGLLLLIIGSRIVRVSYGNA